SLCVSTQSSAQEMERFQHYLQASNSSGAAGQALRAGRDLIGERNWTAAAAKFNEFIRTYPRDKNVDAALYWLAFCLKQQGRPQEADQTLERLLKEYPRSDWGGDARAMRIELADALGNLDAARKVLERDQKISERDQKISDKDDPDEALRLIALQSLF